MPPRPMPAVEIRRILHKLGWKQRHAAKELGISERAMRYYVARYGQMPAPIAELLRRIAQDHNAA